MPSPGRQVVVTRLTAAGHAIAAQPPLDGFPTDDLAADNARMNELLAGVY